MYAATSKIETPLNEPVRTKRAVDWGWIFSALWTLCKSSCDIHLSVPDTVIFHYGAPFKWIATSDSGLLIRKELQHLRGESKRPGDVMNENRNSKQKGTAILIQQQILDIVHSFGSVGEETCELPASGASKVCCVWYRDGRCEHVHVDDLGALTRSRRWLNNVQAIQQYLGPVTLCGTVRGTDESSNVGDGTYDKLVNVDAAASLLTRSIAAHAERAYRANAALGGTSSLKVDSFIGSYILDGTSNKLWFSHAKELVVEYFPATTNVCASTNGTAPGLLVDAVQNTTFSDSEARYAATALRETVRLALKRKISIHTCFGHFDTEGAGHVDWESLQNGLARLGIDVSDGAAKTLLCWIGNELHFGPEDLAEFASFEDTGFIGIGSNFSEGNTSDCIQGIGANECSTDVPFEVSFDVAKTEEVVHAKRKCKKEEGGNCYRASSLAIDLSNGANISHTANSDVSAKAIELSHRISTCVRNVNIECCESSSSLPDQETLLDPTTSCDASCSCSTTNDKDEAGVGVVLKEPTYKKTDHSHNDDQSDQLQSFTKAPLKETAPIGTPDSRSVADAQKNDGSFNVPNHTTSSSSTTEYYRRICAKETERHRQLDERRLMRHEDKRTSQAYRKIPVADAAWQEGSARGRSMARALRILSDEEQRRESELELSRQRAVKKERQRVGKTQAKQTEKMMALSVMQEKLRVLKSQMEVGGTTRDDGMLSSLLEELIQDLKTTRSQLLDVRSKQRRAQKQFCLYSREIKSTQKTSIDLQKRLREIESKSSTKEVPFVALEEMKIHHGHSVKRAVFAKERLTRSSKELSSYNHGVQSHRILLAEKLQLIRDLHVWVKRDIAQCHEDITQLRQQEEDLDKETKHTKGQIETHQQRVDLIRIELERLKSTKNSGRYFDTRLWHSDGIMQRVQTKHFVSSVQKEKDSLSSKIVVHKFRLDEIEKELSSNRRLLSQTSKLRTTKNSIAKQLDEALSEGLEESDSSKTSKVPRSPPFPSLRKIRIESINLATRVRLMPHTHRSSEQREWVNLDYHLNSELYKEEEHFPYPLPPVINTNVEKILNLPEQLQLALPFLKSTDEIRQHYLINKYTLGRGEPYFMAADSEAEHRVVDGMINIHLENTRTPTTGDIAPRVHTQHIPITSISTQLSCAEKGKYEEIAAKILAISADEVAPKAASKYAHENVTTATRSKSNSGKNDRDAEAPALVFASLEDLIANHENETTTRRSNGNFSFIARDESNLNLHQISSHTIVRGEERRHRFVVENSSTCMLHTLTVTIIYQGVFTSTGYQPGKISASLARSVGSSLPMDSNGSIDLLTPIGYASHDEQAINTAASMGRITIRHAYGSPSLPIKSGLFEVLIKGESSTRYSCSIAGEVCDSARLYLQQSLASFLEARHTVQECEREATSLREDIRLAERRMFINDNLIEQANAEVAKAKTDIKQRDEDLKVCFDTDAPDEDIVCIANDLKVFEKDLTYWAGVRYGREKYRKTTQENIKNTVRSLQSIMDRARQAKRVVARQRKELPLATASIFGTSDIAIRVTEICDSHFDIEQVLTSSDIALLCATPLTHDERRVHQQHYNGSYEWYQKATTSTNGKGIDTTKEDKWDRDVRCRLILSEIDRAIRRYSSDEYLVSSILNGTSQKFPTHILRLELERELDRLLTDEILLATGESGVDVSDGSSSSRNNTVLKRSPCRYQRCRDVKPLQEEKEKEMLSKDLLMDNRIALSMIDAELLSACATSTEKTVEVNLHGYNTSLSPENGIVVLQREHNRLVAVTVADEVVNDILDWMQQGWYFGEDSTSIATSSSRKCSSSVTGQGGVGVGNSSDPKKEISNITKTAKLRYQRQLVDEQHQKRQKELDLIETNVKFTLFLLVMKYFRATSKRTNEVSVTDERRKMQQEEEAARQRRNRLQQAMDRAKEGEARILQKKSHEENCRLKNLCQINHQRRLKSKAAGTIQRMYRGHIGRKAALLWKRRMIHIEATNALYDACSMAISRCWRGYQGRVDAKRLRREITMYVFEARRHDLKQEQEGRRKNNGRSK